MIRVFKHYIPHAVLLLGLFDVLLLVIAGEFAWQLRAGQIGITLGGVGERIWPLTGYAVMILAAMISVGRLFPRGDRAPWLNPMAADRLAAMRARDPVLRHWSAGRTLRIDSGFYKSQALQWLAPQARPEQRA